VRTLKVDMRPKRKAIQEVSTAICVLLSVAAYTLEAVHAAHVLAVVLAFGAVVAAAVALICKLSLLRRSSESIGGLDLPQLARKVDTAAYRPTPGTIKRVALPLRKGLTSLAGAVLAAVLAAWVLTYVGPEAGASTKPDPPSQSVAPAPPKAPTHTAKVIAPTGATVYKTAMRLTPTSAHFIAGESIRFSSICISVPEPGAIWLVPDERWLKLKEGGFLAAARVSPKALASVHPTALCPGVLGSLRSRATSHPPEITSEPAYNTLRLSVEAPHAGQVGFAVFELPARRWKTLGMGRRSDGKWTLRYVKHIKGVVTAQACWALGVAATGYADEAPPRLRVIPGSTHGVVEGRQIVAAAEAESNAGTRAACKVPVRNPNLVFAKPPKHKSPPPPPPPVNTTPTTSTPSPTITIKEKVIHG
jgi:hypothetical protein